MKTFDDESEITDSNNGVDGANVLGNMPDFNTHIAAAMLMELISWMTF